MALWLLLHDQILKKLRFLAKFSWLSGKSLKGFVVLGGFLFGRFWYV